MISPLPAQSYRLLSLLAALVLISVTAKAEDNFYEIPIDQLTIKDGKLPVPNDSYDWRQQQRLQNLKPYAVLDGEGEIYLGRNVGRLNTAARWNRNNITLPTKDGDQRENESALAIRSRKGEKVSGRLFVPKADLSGMSQIRFVVSADQASENARKNFFLAKYVHYRQLSTRRIVGNAWFRHQARQSAAVVTGRSIDESPLANPQRPELSRHEDTFQVFSGGRAVSENLQLDRLIAPTAPEEPTVELSSIKGITVAEMDWKELTKEIDPHSDRLAQIVPADQHLVLFPSFQALVTVADEAAEHGTPVLHLLQPRAEDARSRQFYETQLCLSLDGLTRVIGKQMIDRVALTGSDPYLRTGTDVAILFESDSVEAVKGLLISRQVIASQAHPGCKSVSGQIDGIDYHGVVSDDRTICSYLASFDRVVVVTNSLVQIERLARVTTGKSASIGSLPEYAFFRNRYRLNQPQEVSLLIVTDATIRRWCSPKWRIATSRRTRAAAIMAEYQARNFEQLVEGISQTKTIEPTLHVTDLGTLSVTPAGVTSSTYGSLDFQTPISELNLDKVTKSESESYARWRDGYQRYWRQFFDPIAVGFTIGKEGLGADVTVMPLIEQSDYNELIALAKGAEIRADAYDRHAGSLLHWAMAVNVKSQPIQQSSNSLAMIVPALQGNPLSWMGQSISLYFDEDPFWKELATAKEPEKFLQEQFHRVPAAFHAEVSNSLKLALFLAGVKTFIEQAAPGLIRWETLKHHEQGYVKLSPTEQLGLNAPNELAIYYVATPRELVITLREDVLKRAIDRSMERKQSLNAEAKDTNEVAESAKTKKLPPLLGEHIALQLDGRAISLLENFGGQKYDALMQERCWANLHILNEWKRRYPEQSPLELHQRYWQTKLSCPGGGTFQWNEEFQTMESTIYGHPGKPKSGPLMPAPLKNIKSLNFGVTFEHKGLRAKVELQR